ncbi:ComEA family DNA-binding protein [Euzebya pacifica]|uniref:ComEA family DNA-binding protein n=1 Tax=Euzebya pacifica TaxID=1608957 RepID=UPI0030F5ED9C
MGSDGWTEVARRAGMTPAEVAALVVLLLGAVSLTVVVWWNGTDRSPGPGQAPIAIVGAGDAGSTTASADRTSGEDAAADDPPASGSDPTATVVVDVAGLVLRPGLVELPAGSRVADALVAAGGAVDPADTSVLNLARILVDGEQVMVTDGTAPPPVAAGPGGGPDGPTLLADGRLDLNAATVEDLQSLPGVGPVTAERIVARRDELGGFSDVVQLLEVSGIGPARFADLESRVGV